MLHAKTFHRPEKGFILLGMLFMMLLLAITAVALNRRAALQVRMAFNNAQAAQTSLAQRAAIEQVVWGLTQDPLWRTSDTGDSYTYNGLTWNRKVLNSTIDGYTNCITVSVTAPGAQKPLKTSFDYYAYDHFPDPTETGPQSVFATQQVACDTANNIYFADSNNHVIWRRDISTGEVTAVAGTYYSGFSGDGGPATSAKLYNPCGVAVDSMGDIIIADTYNNRIRKVDTTGTITTVAGTEGNGYNGDDQPAVDATLWNPCGVAADAWGNIYIADMNNNRIRKVDSSGTITTVAGDGNQDYTGDNGSATSAALALPQGVAVGTSQNVFYIADTDNHIIRKVDASGIITTVAGRPEKSGYRGDGGEATAKKARLDSPKGVFVDASENIYFADTANHCIRWVEAATGIIDTIAGDGTAGSGTAGDGGPATDARFYNPFGVCLSGSGEVMVSDTLNRRIRHFYPGGTIDSYDMPEILQGLSQPNGIALDGSGNLYIADTLADRIVKVDPSGNETTVAGTGVAGFSGDNGPAVDAMLDTPYDVAVDFDGNLFISDANNHRIRKVDTGGTITTVAGNGTQGYSGDGGPASSAMLDSPYGVAVDTSGNLYIADWFNHRIRKVDTFGTINTIAGTGTANYSGEGVATEQDLQYPRDVSLDTLGNIYIADTDNHRIRKVDTSGMISTVAGNGSQGYNGDGLLAIDACLSRPRDVVVDSNGHIFLTDESNHRVRMVNAYDGIITTIAGTGTLGFNGHHQRAILSDLSSPCGIAMPAVRGGGQIYFSDCGNNMVRKLGFHVVAELY